MQESNNEARRPPVHIRPATPEDAETICDIRDRAWLEAYPNAELGISVEDIRVNAQGRDGEFVPRRIAYLQEKLSKHNASKPTVLVARVDGNIVGYIEPGIDEQDKHWIHAIYVAPETQGLGVGTQLMQAALADLGYDHDILLEVVSYNKKAIDFYKGFGFVETDAIVPVEQDRPDYLTTLPQIEMVLPAKP